jgi:hypothetical protein
VTTRFSEEIIMMGLRRWLALSLALVVACVAVHATAAEPEPGPPPRELKAPPTPSVRDLVRQPQSELAEVVRRFEADRGSLMRAYSVPGSTVRHNRLRQFCSDWLDALSKVDAARLCELGRADYDRIHESIWRELRQLDLQGAQT